MRGAPTGSNTLAQRKAAITSSLYAIHHVRFFRAFDVRRGPLMRFCATTMPT